jgi:phosphate starvation-inducible PhoH-like protein
MSGLNETQSVYQFSNQSFFRSLCGIADSEISHLENLLHVALIPRGFSFVIRSDSRPDTELAEKYFALLEKQYGDSQANFPERFDKEYLFNQLKDEIRSGSGKNHTGRSYSDSSDEIDSEDDIPGELSSLKRYQELLKTRIFVNHKGKEIFPRTVNQALYAEAALGNAVTISVGPAGTGKTFLSIAIACRLLTKGEVERIILTRPAVEAGESLGFLPGDMAQKVDPYLRPVYDSLYELLGIEKVTELIISGRIEIAPLAFMRGRTLNNAVVILDEAQNCTLSQLKMFLTRLGRNSKMIIGGDVTQIDLPPGRSGLEETVRILKKTEGVAIVEFVRKDIVRHPLVERIVNAFESYKGNNDR